MEIENEKQPVDSVIRGAEETAGVSWRQSAYCKGTANFLKANEYAWCLRSQTLVIKLL
jgi:hypothetical protein